MEGKGKIKETSLVNLTERSTQSVNKVLWERMRKDPRFEILTDEARTKLKKERQKILALVDANGKEYEANLNNPEDLRKLEKDYNLMILNTKKDEKVTVINDMKTAVISLTSENLPKDLNQNKFLPFSQIYLINEMLEHKNSIDDILIWIPLLNVPVYTSFLILLLTGKSATTTSDSFTMLQEYILIMKFLSHVDFIRSRKDICLTWLSNRLKSGLLTKQDLERFSENAIVYEKDVNLFNPYDLILKFEQNKLTLDNIGQLKSKYIEDVKRYETGWSKDRVFREDIIEEFTDQKQELTRELYSRINKENEVATQENDYDTYIKVIYSMTFKFLHCYEIFIMKMCQEASTTITIPNKYWQNLMTRQQKPLLEHINEKVKQSIIEKRKKMTKLRDEQIRKITSETPAINLEGKETVLPSSFEIFSYLQFLNYYAETNEDLKQTVQNLKSIFESMNGLTLEDNKEEQVENKSNGMPEAEEMHIE